MHSKRLRVTTQAYPIGPRAALGEILAIGLVLACSAIACAQVAGPLILTYEFSEAAPRKPKAILPPLVAVAPEIDGEVRDDAWGRSLACDIASDMAGGSVSRLTAVRVCRDDANLYVAFVCREPVVAELPLANKRVHDIWSEENVQVWLAPTETDGDFYLLAVDPNGLRYDLSLRGGVAWSPEWEAKALRLPDGWNVEIAIPFKSITGRPPRVGESWRVNFCRDIATTGERASWESTFGNRRNPAAWGLLFFGDVDSYARMPSTPRLTLYPDQWTIRGDDRTLRLVVRIDPGSGDLNRMRLKVGLSADAKIPASSMPPPAILSVKGARANLLLNVAALPQGNFKLYAELLDTEGNAICRAEAPINKEPPVATVLGGKARIIVPPCAAKGRMAAAWPIHTGVALPKGALQSPAGVRLLTADGKEVPCKAHVRSRWPGDGSVRWLGLDFRADLTRQADETLTLEYGPQIAPEPVRGFTRKITTLRFDVEEDAWVLETDEAWWINTGALLFSVNKRYSGIEGAWVDVDGNGHFDWTEQIINAEAGGLAGPYMVDSTGRVYRISADPQVRVDVEEWNELSVTLRVEGRLVPVGHEASLTVGRCLLRITAYAGAAFLRIQCVFTLNERGAHTQFADIGMAERLEFKRCDAVFGVPGGFRQPLKDVGPIFLMQLGPGQCLLQNQRNPPTVNWRGTESLNWAAATVADRGFGVILCGMAQLYPKSLELIPDSRESPRSRLVTHFWPPHGSDEMRNLRTDVDRRTVGALGFATSGRFLDLAVPAFFAGGLKDREGLDDFDAVRSIDLGDPTGLSMTYEMLYVFHKGQTDPQEMAEFARLAEMRPHAVQDASSLAASGVLPEMLTRPRADRAAAMLARLLKREERAPAAGEFNYLDVHRHWRTDEQRWALRNQWMGSSADLPGALWLLYLQSGRLEVLRIAEANIRHVLSVDVCHEASRAQISQADPRRRKIPGAFGNHRTPLHWLSTCSVSDRQARVRGLLLAYYLAGNTIARDTALLWAEAARNYGPPQPDEDGLAYLSNLSEMLLLRYDPALLERMGETADYVLRMPLDIAGLEQWIPGLRSYQRWTGDRRPVAWLQAVAGDVRTLGLDSFRLIGLLRDLGAMGDARAAEQANRLLAEFEAALDKNPDDPALLNWDNFCAYVFGAAVPAETLLAAPAK